MARDDLVVDASVVINILGTGEPESFLEILPARLLIPSKAAEEVIKDPADRLEKPDILIPLMEGGHLERVEMNADAVNIFLELVSGSLVKGLHDGEASVIACAATMGAGAVLDERKGRRICNERFPEVPLFYSLDLFRWCLDQARVEKGRVARWLQSSIRKSRLRTPHEYRSWVGELVK